MADSARKGQSLVVIKGINDNKFNSNPNHAPNQDVDEIDRIVPVNNVKKNNR